MIITYPDGRAMEGFLLSRQETSMRVALKGCDDVLEFFEVQGNWVSEDFEPVDIVFEWQRRPHAAPALSEADFVCSKDLLDRLIRMLETDSDKEKTRPLKYRTAGNSIM